MIVAVRIAVLAVAFGCGWYFGYNADCNADLDNAFTAGEVHRP